MNVLFAPGSELRPTPLCALTTPDPSFSAPLGTDTPNTNYEIWTSLFNFAHKTGCGFLICMAGAFAWWEWEDRYWAWLYSQLNLSEKFHYFHQKLSGQGKILKLLFYDNHLCQSLHWYFTNPLMDVGQCSKSFHPNVNRNVYRISWEEF